VVRYLAAVVVDLCVGACVTLDSAAKGDSSPRVIELPVLDHPIAWIDDARSFCTWIAGSARPVKAERRSRSFILSPSIKSRERVVTTGVLALTYDE
jgi:hypothetical protein